MKLRDELAGQEKLLESLRGAMLSKGEGGCVPRSDSGCDCNFDYTDTVLCVWQMCC